ncbi:MAG: phosphatase PAP2 family protein, partial [Anaerolineales bacterium]|nr:phosphatase PAP2 family protein [Anaerolineales bacterium]
VKIAHILQSSFGKTPLLPILQEIWFFGRTSFSVIFLLIMTVYNWKMGSVAALIFLIIVGVENLIKKTFTRSRPYSTISEINILQPKITTDPSFPSGDTLRIWYLALILPAATGDNIILLTACMFIAILVSLGRMVMGVHYFTDTLSGAGLGLLGAGTTIWLWNYLAII